MAHLGTIELLKPASGLRAGAAFTLAAPASTSATVAFEEAEAEVSEGQREIVVRFPDASDARTAFERGHRLAQNGLDLLSVLGRLDAIIQHGEKEHFLWWTDRAGVVLRSVSITLLKFGIGPATVTFRDKDGNVRQPAVATPQHHLGFRYYRLSQVTDDLYDAYRNIYLAFELILSSRFPKLKAEKEIDWLQRSLASADRDIGLRELTRSNDPDVVQSILQTVYYDARLPLFHAKDGRGFYAPGADIQDRTTVSRALEQLTRIVLRLAERWYNTRRMGGGVFFSWVYESARNSLKKHHARSHRLRRAVRRTGTRFVP